MENIIIKNQNELKSKIEKIKKDGKDHLHVISDFDRTLTPTFFEGKKADTGIAQVRAGGYLSPEYVKQAYALKEKYYPIEIDASIPLEEKSEKMMEWWSTHLGILVKYGLTLEVFDDILNKKMVKPREGSLKFYDFLHKNNIPLIIFSAGLGDLIEGFLKKEGKFYDNTHVISNFYEFDEEGKVLGYKSEIIHTFNKNEGQIKKTDFYDEIKHRKNVILIGDGIGDLGMAEGLEHDTIIRIGFLNENKEKLLSLFEKEFDVVILDDGSMEYINDMLNEVIGK